MSVVGGAKVFTDHLIGGPQRRHPCKQFPPELSEQLKLAEEKKKQRHELKKKMKQDRKRERQRRQERMMVEGSVHEWPTLSVTENEAVDLELDVEVEGGGKGLTETERETFQQSMEDVLYSDVVGKEKGKGMSETEAQVQNRSLHDLQSEAEKALCRYFYAHAVPYNHAKSPHFLAIWKT